MSATCPLCRRACRVRFSKNRHDIWRCDRCDLELVWPTPSARQLAEVYERGYFTGPGAGYEDYFARERDIAARKSRQRLDRAYALGCRGGRALDVGCAAGFFLEAARARGFTVRGVEPSAEARERAAPEVRDAISPELGEHEGDFDLITLWDVLEHLPDPSLALASLAPRLSRGGLMGVVVPVLGSVNTRVAPLTWDQYKPPEHLWYFSRRSLRALLASHGLEVVHEEAAWVRDARFVDPAFLRRDPLTAMLRSVDGALHRLASLVLGDALRTDSVAVYARRRGAS